MERSEPPTSKTQHDRGIDARRRLLAIALGAVLLAPGCVPPGKPNPDDRPKTPGQIVDFDVLFRHRCSGCHGADGKLGPAPPLNDPLFLEIISVADIEKIVRDGRHGTPMPAFARSSGGTLTDAQIKILAEQIPARWKSDKKPESPPPAYRLASSDEAGGTVGDAKRGEALFERACAECHGEQGDGEFSEAGAINDPAFLGLISDQALRRIIITGRPDLGMPTYAESEGRPSDYQPLTSDEINDLVALLASWRQRGDVAMQP